MIEHLIEDCQCPGKKCSTCEKVKCHLAFARGKAYKGGLFSQCKRCINDRRKEYRRKAEPGEKHRQTSRDQYWINRETIKARRNSPDVRTHRLEVARQYRTANHEALRIRWMQHKEANRERFLNLSREKYYRRADHYRAKRRVETHTRRARKRQNGGKFTSQEWKALCARYEYQCLCCGRQEPEIKLNADHVIPLSKGGLNKISNIQPLCSQCNRRKWNNTTDYRPDAKCLGF